MEKKFLWPLSRGWGGGGLKALVAGQLRKWFFFVASLIPFAGIEATTTYLSKAYFKLLAECVKRSAIEIQKSSKCTQWKICVVFVFFYSFFLMHISNSYCLHPFFISENFIIYHFTNVFLSHFCFLLSFLSKYMSALHNIMPNMLFSFVYDHRNAILHRSVLKHGSVTNVHFFKAAVQWSVKRHS